MDWKKKDNRGFNQGIDQSKVLLGKATNQVKNIGEQTLLNAEIRDLELKEETLYVSLGREIYNLLIKSGKTSVSLRTPEIKDIFPEIDNVISDLTLKKTAEEKEK